MFGTKKHSKANRLQKTIKCKTVNRIGYKIFILKYTNTNYQVQLVIAVFASTKLALNYIKQARSN